MKIILYNIKLLKILWMKIIFIIIYFKNYNFISNFKEIILYEIWNKKKLNISNFKIFKNYIYIHILKNIHIKFDYNI